MNIPAEVKLDLETKSEAFKRGALDCYQDSCENAPFASVGGLLGRSAELAAPAYVPEPDRSEWVAGYEYEAAHLYGDDWRTCDFGWRPAIKLGGDGDA